MRLELLKRFESLTEAELAKNVLEQQGIKSVFQKDGIPGSTNMIQGAELYVEESDIQRASDLLSI